MQSLLMSRSQLRANIYKRDSSALDYHSPDSSHACKQAADDPNRTKTCCPCFPIFIKRYATLIDEQARQQTLFWGISVFGLHWCSCRSFCPAPKSMIEFSCLIALVTPLGGRADAVLGPEAPRKHLLVPESLLECRLPCFWSQWSLQRSSQDNTRRKSV